SAANQCRLSVCISAAYQCASVPPISSRQCRLTVPCQSVPPNSAIYQCCLSMPISATYQCLLISAHQCHLSVSISAAYQCPSLQPH
ncbi:unnamed protein product, partial [Staurois parvus]